PTTDALSASQTATVPATHDQAAAKHSLIGFTSRRKAMQSLTVNFSPPCPASPGRGSFAGAIVPRVSYAIETHTPPSQFPRGRLMPFFSSVGADALAGFGPSPPGSEGGVRERGRGWNEGGESAKRQARYPPLPRLWGRGGRSQYPDALPLIRRSAAPS